MGNLTYPSECIKEHLPPLKWFFSTTVTLKPAFARRAAVATPPTPAPVVAGVREGAVHTWSKLKYQLLSQSFHSLFVLRYVVVDWRAASWTFRRFMRAATMTLDISHANRQMRKGLLQRNTHTHNGHSCSDAVYTLLLQLAYNYTFNARHATFILCSFGTVALPALT